MKPRISVFTLGVTDLEKSVAFYRDGLALKTDGIIGKVFEFCRKGFGNRMADGKAIGCSAISAIVPADQQKSAFSIYLQL